MFLDERACRLVQRIYRGYRIRIAIKLANIASYKIQSAWKTEKLTRLIREMRKNAKILQFNVKIFLYRKKAYENRLADFFKEEKSFFDNNNIECDKHLFPNRHQIKNNNLHKNNNFSKNNIFESVYQNVNNPHQQTQKKIYLPKQTVLNDPKLLLFAKVLDLDFNIDSNEIYDNHWASEFEKVFNLNIENGTPIQQIHLGGCHTIVVNNKGKIYSWGWNNYGQCCEPSKSI